MPEMMTGGWQVNQNIPTVNLEADAEKVFRSATTLFGQNYDPLELLSHQVVNGVKYKFLAYQSSPRTPDQKEIVILTIWAKTDGTCKIENCVNVGRGA